MTDETNLRFEKKAPGSFIAFEVTYAGPHGEIDLKTFAVIRESDLMHNYRQCVEYYDGRDAYTSRSARVADGGSTYSDPDVFMGISSSTVALLGAMSKTMRSDIAAIDNVLGSVKVLRSVPDKRDEILKGLLTDDRFVDALIDTLDGLQSSVKRHHDSTIGMIRYLFDMLEFASCYDHQRVLAMVAASEYLYGLVTEAKVLLSNRDMYLDLPQAVVIREDGRQTRIRDLPPDVVESMFASAISGLEVFLDPNTIQLVSGKMLELSGFNG